MHLIDIASNDAYNLRSSLIDLDLHSMVTLIYHGVSMGLACSFMVVRDIKMAKGINANSTNKCAPNRRPIRAKSALFEILSHALFNFWGKYYGLDVFL